MLSKRYISLKISFLILILKGISPLNEYATLDHKYIYIPGDFVLGALFDIRGYGKGYMQCDSTIQPTFVVELEAFLYALDYVNTHLLHNFTLGGWVLNSCDNAVIGEQQNMKFLEGLMQSGGICEGKTGRKNSAKVVYGVTGSITSALSRQISHSLAYYCVPLISAYATSTELDDKRVHPYFMRTQPSDRYQAEAIFELLLKMDWTFVTLMFEDTSYGLSLQKRFTELIHKAEHKQVCIENSIAIHVEEPHWHNSIKTLSESKSRILVIFAGFSIVKQLFDFIKVHIRQEASSLLMKVKSYYIN